MNKLYKQAAGGFLRLLLVLPACVFLPAGTFHYWQGWLFIAVFAVCSFALTLYLAVTDPQLLARRMSIGPAAEKETSQKFIVAAMLLILVATPVVSAMDHRLGWSSAPAMAVVAGDLLIVLAHIGFVSVFRANTYCAATIQVAQSQNVVSTGPYAMLRHPMYAWNLPMVVGTALALGSWWGTLMAAPMIGATVARILNEEKYLTVNLAGYSDYTRKVRYRLVPFIW
jgi:protein-S-isoprenylcysteine O-methyltransferase Ste14